MHRQCKRR